MTREEFVKKWSMDYDRGAGFTPNPAAELELSADLDSLLPPAEGAELSIEEIKNEGIKYLQNKYPDKEILKLPDIDGGSEFADFAMGLQIGYSLCSNKISHQPTAEGAEEILIDDIEAIADKYEIVERIDDDPDTGNMRFVINDQFVELVRIASVKFATLHAQRLAEKMVEERLREELVKYRNWIFDDDEFTERSVNEYLKSREK